MGINAYVNIGWPLERKDKGLVMQGRPGRSASVDEATSARMRAVRVKDTAPEMAVRRLLWQLGHRYRVCPKDLPGKPDIANRAGGWCIFVHGCFWHGHEGCKLGRLPKKNRSWWAAKIEDNKARDARHEEKLRGSGFRVLVVWQCQLGDVQALSKRLDGFVRDQVV